MMYRINGYDVELTRGDSLTLRVLLSGRDLPEGTDAVFTLKTKPRETAHLLQKRFDASDEQVIITLTPDETDLAPRTDYWDLRLQIPQDAGGYEIYTPMEYAAFTILDVIGASIGTGESESMNPDLPVLQVVLTQAREVLAAAETAVNAVNGMTAEAFESDTPSAAVTDVDGHKHIAFGIVRGPEGQRGPQGEPGAGLRILGTHASQSALASAVTAPKQGDMYQVGTAAPYTIWMWDAAKGWLSLGQLQGAQGATFTPFLSTNGDLSWSNDNGLINPETVNIKGPQGNPGPAGQDGSDGADGYTPVRGTDYWTDADVAQIKAYVDDAILNGAW